MGIGCAARSRMAASMSTSSSEAISVKIHRAALCDLRVGEVGAQPQAIQGAEAFGRDQRARDALVDLPPFRQRVRLSEGDPKQHRRVHVGNHRCPWRSSSSSLTMSTSSFAGFGSRTRHAPKGGRGCARRVHDDAQEEVDGRRSTSPRAERHDALDVPVPEPVAAKGAGDDRPAVDTGQKGIERDVARQRVVGRHLHGRAEVAAAI